ncbi:hypothetical protein HRI_003788800 [Hibiscus trionum]|uniref:Uncharacterized protein n=1 Tax=Hibiscus trionum TaxID=183268 RepID=A0A9W7MKS6_HIBTR|nr:hypothetical protein HRI_003788800 [Hibiscus trionum]
MSFLPHCCIHRILMTTWQITMSCQTHRDSEMDNDLHRDVRDSEMDNDLHRDVIQTRNCSMLFGSFLAAFWYKISSLQ